MPDVELTSFLLAVKRRVDESAVFAWITWPSNAERDAGMTRAKADPPINSTNNPMPVDGKRLIYGGFEVLLMR